MLWQLDMAGLGTTANSWFADTEKRSLYEDKLDCTKRRAVLLNGAFSIFMLSRQLQDFQGAREGGSAKLLSTDTLKVRAENAAALGAAEARVAELEASYGGAPEALKAQKVFVEKMKKIHRLEPKQAGADAQDQQLVEARLKCTELRQVYAEQAVAHFEQYVARVEIKNGLGQLERVYFRFPAFCLLLTEESKQEILWGVDRNTPGKQIQELLGRSREASTAHRTRDLHSHSFARAFPEL